MMGRSTELITVHAICDNPDCRREFTFQKQRGRGMRRRYCQKSCRQWLREQVTADETQISRGLKQRAKPGTSGHAKKTSDKRRNADPITCDIVYTDEETTFFQAVEHYKKRFRRPFPALCEILEVLKCLGYRKVAEPIPVPKVPDRATDPPEC